MPPLAPLALIYLLWLIGLRIVYGLLVAFVGVPQSPATVVILASIPAMDIGVRAAKRATRDLTLTEWARIWGLCVSIFLVLQVIIPAIIVPQLRVAMNDPEVLQNGVIVLIATAVMTMLFLYIGKLMGTART